MTAASSSRLPRIVLWGGLVLGLAIVACVCIASWRAEHALVHEWGLALDDSWIHCTIARNLAQGHGWSYNPGVPVQNSSGPLWTALVALGFLVAGPQVWVPKALGAVCLLGCVLYAWRLGRRWTALASGTDRDADAQADIGASEAATGLGPAVGAATAALFTALSAPLAWHGLSGMETPLAALLVAVTLDVFQAWQRGRHRFTWTAAAALAAMARPETLLLVPLLVFERWYRSRTWSRTHGELASRAPASSRSTMGAVSPLREAVVALGLCVVFLLPYFVLNLATTGSLFPATFAAKAGNTGLGSALRHTDPKEFVVALSLYAYVWAVHAVTYLAQTNVALVLLAALGAWATARGPRGFLGPGLLLVALPALRGAAAPHLTPEIQHGRYIASLLPVYFACAGVGFVALLRAARPFATAGKVARIALVGVAVPAVLAVLRLELRIPDAGPEPFAALATLWPGSPGSSAWLHLQVRDEFAGLLVIALGAAALLVLGFAPRGALRSVGLVCGILGIGLHLAVLRGLPNLYARNVRNIHQMDVELGRWVKAQVPQGMSLAVNDIGAIAFFGEHPLIDAMGLATPELVPYSSPSKLRRLAALRRMHPQICIFFPNWFPTWLNRPSLFIPVLRHRVEDNTVLGSPLAIVYRTDWERFGRYYDDTLLERLDPPQAYDSWHGHWKRGLINLHLPSRAQLYMEAGERAGRQRDFAGALQDFRKAVELDATEEGAWKGLLDALRASGDREGYGKAVQEMVRAVPLSSDTHELLAEWQYATGHVEEAGRTFEQALSLHPDSIEILGKLEGYWRMRGDAERSSLYRTRREELAAGASGATPTSP